MKIDRRFLLYGFSFLFYIAVSHPSYAEDNLPEIIKVIQPSVVVVLTYNQEGAPMGQGSGFFFGKTGDVITNYHVIRGASRAEVKVADGTVYPVTHVVAEDIKGDIIGYRSRFPKTPFAPCLSARPRRKQVKRYWSLEALWDLSKRLPTASSPPFGRFLGLAKSFR